jgi:hypothetical protein
MTRDELKEWANGVLDGELMEVDSIIGINFDPHPYVIGTRHVAYASDRFGGLLGDAAIRSAEATGVKCAMKGGCSVSYDQHKSDTAAFVRLKRDLSNKEAAGQLSLLKEKFEEEGIDGFAFIEDGFRIAPPIEEG